MSVLDKVLDFICIIWKKICAVLGVCVCVCVFSDGEWEWFADL